ncbi:mechanosensitive ion channel family protein [Lyngbya aestuarii BL J]|uniref:Mechanosensitive ion channel family protein n=1 Tax=Lyngbya aestuarii BL J TaxID=1348334 RepID=U7QS30_9CYAN|nr:mechanosensitive ion channel family protein [Lyngbya aestuarii]ERT09885.1 mechanosensitive ion channel family protein [Lyngbya aestuarii BL J]
MKYFKLFLLQKLKLPFILFISITIFVLITPLSIAQTEDVIVPTPQQSSASPVNQSQDGLYFSDVLVRGRPIFQIGSLAEVSASDRAKIINRRIASLLSQSDSIPPVSVNINSNQNIATLQVKNRVLMTVTQQDAQDFGLELEVLAQRWKEQLNIAFDKRPLAIDVGQRLYETIRQFFRDTISNLPAFIGALIVVFFTWGVASAVRYAAFKWAQKTEGDSNTEVLIGRLSYGGIWVLGSVVALGVLGLDFAALLGAFGLTSVAIGFSLKDVLSNYISGVILLAARPFRINDQVVIEDFEGTITQIQLRGTTLRTYDGRLVYIPNQEVFQASIINNTASPRRRSSVIVGIDYGEDLSTAQKVILNALHNMPEVETNPAADILVKELAPSTVNLEVRFWVDSRRAGYLATTSHVTQAIKEALEQANIDMPTDIYTLVFRNLPNQVNGNVTAQLNQE